MIHFKQNVLNSTSPDYEESLKKVIAYKVPHYLGKCNKPCKSCGALHWSDESTLAERSKSSVSYSTCCQKNKVSLPSSDPTAPSYPNLLKNLLSNSDQRSKDFQSLTRMYNNAMSFTSLGANIDRSVDGPMGVRVFKVSGGLTHRIASIEPMTNNPGFAQIYVVGNKGVEEANYRIAKACGKAGDQGAGSKMKQGIILELISLMSRINPYAQRFRSALDILKDSNAKTLKLQGVPTPGADPKRYNCPTIDEVAVVVEGDGDIIQERQILLHRRDAGLDLISDCHSAYFPLRYPILFPHGEQQWDNLYRAHTGRVQNRKVGSLEWFAYLMFQRRKRFSAILAGRSLFQEILVDMYVCIERQRLQFISSNQEKLKVNQYNRLVNSLKTQSEITGRRVILPSTFIGSPRCMQQLYHDSMALCRRFGPPSLFITMTANPNWREIVEEIGENEKSYDHPTVVARVFYLKMKELIIELVKMERYGRVVAYVYTVEFQKRGLPHLHLMLTLDENDKPVTPEEIDRIVTAELPDPIKSPVLFALASKFMLHGPCLGRPCWNGKICKYGFPKPFTDRTVNIEGTYPVYKRRDDGRIVKKHTTTFKNGNVVPYSPFLTRMFECHINVEVPVSTTAIKYLYKYITKGHDRLSLCIDGDDEVKSFVEGRYVSPVEAAWRIFKFPLSDRSPAVTRLNIHDEGELLVYFSGQEGLEGQINTGRANMTTLTGFYQLNIDDAIGADGVHARSLFYEDIPTYFSWNKAKKLWLPRKSKSDCVGRIFSVSYLAGEKFYLRVLLLNRKGVTSHQDLRTLNGELCADYQTACNDLGLLVNDFLYNESLTEASFVRTGFQLTQMFAMICVHSPPSAPRDLFDNHYLSFTDDCSRRDMTKRNSTALNDIERRVMALFRLKDLFEGMGRTLEACGIGPTPTEHALLATMEAAAENREDPSEIAQRIHSNVKSFNRKQEGFYLKITRALERNKPSLFYLDGPGGTGKTFLLNTLVDYASLKDISKVVVASSGVAALLLKGGQTAHSAFKIPIEAEVGGECPIDSDTALAGTLRDVRLIIWDEIVTIHKNSIEAVNVTLKRICKSELDFAGKIVVFSGDFRQILPVVKYDQFPPSHRSTIKSLPMWNSISQLKLTVNMRLASAIAEEDSSANVSFSRDLLQLGEGKLQDSDFGIINLKNIPLESFESNIQMRKRLIDFVYKDLEANTIIGQQSTVNYLNERCILAPLNRDVKILNDQILAALPGDATVMTSIDTPDPDSVSSLPEEVLNKISVSGIPEHAIEVKIGMPLVVMRNMDIGNGVCNGLRIVVDDFGIGFIAGRLMSGPFAGQEVTLPRVKLQNKSSARSGLSFFGYQFPVAPAYAMSVNKSQGQTLKTVGVYLETDMFSHGQLYVAVSRATDVKNLLVVKPSIRTGIVNVVHKDIFGEMDNIRKRNSAPVDDMQLPINRRNRHRGL